MSNKKEDDYPEKAKNNAKASKKTVKTIRKQDTTVKDQKQTQKSVVIFLKKLGKTFLAIITIEAILFALFEAMVNSKSFIRTYGCFFFSYIWVILPILITLFFPFLPIKKNDRLKNFRIFSVITTGVIAIILGYLSYQNSQKTNLTIYSEHLIYRIKFESRTHTKRTIDLEPKQIDKNAYFLDRRLPFDDYNIIVTFKSEPSQFFTKTLKKRTEKLVVF